MEHDKHFEERVYQMAFHYFISIHEIEFNPLEDTDEELVVEIAHASHYLVLKPKVRCTFPHGAFLIQGNLDKEIDDKLSDVTKMFHFEDMHFIMPSQHVRYTL